MARRKNLNGTGDEEIMPMVISMLLIIILILISCFVYLLRGLSLNSFMFCAVYVIRRFYFILFQKVKLVNPRVQIY